VIMVSANGLPEQVQAALDAGAVAHVVKPIEPAVLVGTISSTVLAAQEATGAAD